MLANGLHAPKRKFGDTRGVHRIFQKGFPLECGYISTHFKELERAVQISVK